MERITVTEQKAKEMEEWARQVKLPLFWYVRAFRIPVPDAWDIVQDVFIYLCAREEPLPEAPHLRKALLLRIARFRVLAHFNERERHGERAALAHEYAVFAGKTYERDLSGVIEAREQLELILPAISDEQYDVFTTRVLEGLKVCDVAARLGMNDNTARGCLSRALEVLREKLENLEHRGARSVLILLGISSILALAETASAMVGRIKRFFLSFEHAPLRGVASVATAAAIMLLPPNSGASADSCPNSEKQAPSRTATNTTPQPRTPNLSIVPEKPAAGQSSSVSPMSTSSAPRPVPRQTAPKKAHVKVAPPDHLLAKAMSAFRNGKPEKVLELLDQYPVQDLKWANELREQAKKALAAKKPTEQ